MAILKNTNIKGDLNVSEKIIENGNDIGKKYAASIILENGILKVLNGYGDTLSEILIGSESSESEEPSTNYLTFSSPSEFSLKSTNIGWDGTIEYSTDTNSWTIWEPTWTNGTINSSNGKLYLRGTGNTIITEDECYWTLIGSNISCIGNIETLLDYQAVENGEHPTMSDYCFYGLFWECEALVSAPALPATTLTSYCYSEMFYNCTSLTTAPALPATTLANSCYDSMFFGCTSLTTAPALPATTLTTYCYAHMFYGCTSLATPPTLPATTLTRGCYDNMFFRCTQIRLSQTKTGVYQTAYRIPMSGTGTTELFSLDEMFGSTGGTFTGTPAINTTYYIA